MSTMLLRLLALLVVVLTARAASAETLLVRTLDPATGGPIAGAFVLVGPAAEDPFPGNSGLTGPDGTILFSDPGLIGSQMVTAGTAEHAYVTITAAPLGTVTLHLPLRAAPDTLPDPVARVTGRGLNIATTSNDGNLDIGFALPALDLTSLIGTTLLGSGGAPFESPPDTANFPAPIGPTEVPGIMTMPTQTELLFLVFQKPVYKIDLPDQTTQSLFCLSGRIAIADLTALGGTDLFALLNAFSMREVGVERHRAITNGAVIDIDVDLNLSPTLNVQFAGVPAGDEISAGSAARITEPGGLERYVLYDGKSRLIDQGSALTLSSLNPAGDLADAVNAVVATHGDSAATPEFLSGIIKRDGFAVPATLVMDTFMLTPEIAQQGSRFDFTDATNPGVSPTPTWAQAGFVLTDVEGGSGVPTTTHWVVYVPAAELGFTLPALPAGAPPSLPDPGTTPEADRLRVTLVANNQTGDAAAVLADPLGDATHFALRTADVRPPTSGVAAAEPAPIAAARLGSPRPNPFNPRVVVPVTPALDGALALDIVATSGRVVRRLTAPGSAFETTALVWDGRDQDGRDAPSGVYIARLSGVAGAEVKMVLLR